MPVRFKNYQRLDFSSGDPLRPFARAAADAFHRAAANIHEYQTITRPAANPVLREVFSSIGAYLSARGFHDAGWSGTGVRDIVMTGGGTTEGYELTIRALATDFREWQRRSKDTATPVIVMPVPTYGFFFENPKNWGLEIVTIERDWRGDGALDVDALRALLVQLNQDNKRVLAYYDCSPNNPLGVVRSAEETRGVARLFMALNEYYRKRYPTHRDGLTSRVKIIDDLIYQGLEYDGVAPGLAFAQLEREAEFQGIFKNTVSLMGVSKAGLAALRAGLVVGDPRLMDRLREIQQTTSYFHPSPAMYALESYFTDRPEQAALRQAHLTRMNEDHRFAGVLMKVLVNGIDDAGDVAPQDMAKIRDIVTDRRLLRGGIPGVRVITNPQAGFFHLLDFSALLGRSYKTPSGERKLFEGEELVYNLLTDTRLHMAYGYWMGLSPDKAIMRASFAKPHEEIIAMVQRLRAGLREAGLVPAKKPSAQKPVPVPVYDSVNSAPRCQVV